MEMTTAEFAAVNGVACDVLDAQGTAWQLKRIQCIGDFGGAQLAGLRKPIGGEGCF